MNIERAYIERDEYNGFSIKISSWITHSSGESLSPVGLSMFI